MGDWAITYHWTTGKVRLPRFRDDRWAARYGVVAPGVTQIETVQKYGFKANQDAAFGACDACDYLRDTRSGEFFAGWNYLLACEPVRGLFTATTSAMEGVAAVDDETPTRMLCLREPIRYERAAAHFAFDDSHRHESRALRVFEAVVSSEPALQGKTSRFVTGLWTRSRGYWHTGEVVFSLEWPWLGSGSVEHRVTGAANLMTAPWQGPYAGSPYADRPAASCVAKPAMDWPFS